LQDDLAAAEIAALPGTDRVLADVVHPVLEDAAAAFRALAQRFPSREVDRFGLVVVGVGLPEIELQPVLVVQLQDRRERTPEPAAESLQRTDRALAQQLLGLLDVELAPAGDLRDRELAAGAGEALVVLLHDAAAARARRGERRVVA